MSQRCICQICSCGKHHCPGQKTVENVVPYTGCALSEYQESFIAHNNTFTHVAQKQQDEWEPPKGKMATMTTFRDDYVPHHTMRRSLRATRPYVPPHGTMMLTSTYTEDYKVNPLQNKMVKKPQYSPPTTKMAATSLYKDDFKPWCTVKRQCFTTTDNLTVNQSKFATSATIKDGYSSQRGNFKSVPQKTESQPFDGTTSYRLHYVLHPVQPKQPREGTAYRPSSSAFCGTSTYKEDYKGPPATLTKPIKAKMAWKNNSNCLQGTKEVHDQYKPWNIQPKQSHKAKHSPQENDMSFLSPIHADYVAHAYNQDQPVWQSTQWPNTHMTENTSYNTSYSGRHPRPCPARFAEPPGYEYTYTKAGHKLYTSISMGGNSLDNNTSRKIGSSTKSQPK